ncbi:hypothetical protein FACS1894180_0540 [Bacteroidia bacterium]|nr:hypothetical protein FACS1894178_4070 [Bacteroidia bacterium]GHV42918.1 hypothetical protein FACS1894180_0540 [Bacteroidia bacterium]
MREANRDIERIEHILEEIDNIFEFVENSTFGVFQQNKMMKYAVYRSFTIIGEAANLLTKEYKGEHKDVEWGKIIGMRQLILKSYGTQSLIICQN